MKKDYIESGKIVGTHGVRGGLRVQPWCDSPEFLCQFKNLFLKNSDGYNSVKVKMSKPHGNVVIMELEGVNSMDDAEALRGKVLFIERKALKLEEGQYLISDLMEIEVFDADSGKLLGKISDVSKTGANDVYIVKNEEGKEFLFPAIKECILNVDFKKKKITVHVMDGLLD